MRETQIPIGALVAAIGGVLLIVSLALDWYGGLSGFTSFEFLDLLLVLLALVAIASLVTALGLVRLPLRPGGGLPTTQVFTSVIFIFGPPEPVRRPSIRS